MDVELLWDGSPEPSFRRGRDGSGEPSHIERLVYPGLLKIPPRSTPQSCRSTTAFCRSISAEWMLNCCGTALLSRLFGEVATVPESRPTSKGWSTRGYSKFHRDQRHNPADRQRL